jgi:DNA-binding protein H-NS
MTQENFSKIFEAYLELLQEVKERVRVVHDLLEQKEVDAFKKYSQAKYEEYYD